MTVERFRSVLARLGPDPTAREIAEVLWLATRLPAAASSSDANAEEDSSPQVPAEYATGSVPALADEEATGEGSPAIPVHAPVTAPHPGDAYSLPARPVRLAADPHLPHRLELQRALRPLKRRVPSRHAGELDEEATVDSLAQRSAPHRRGALLPVLRPAPERWLDAVLVVDGHQTGLLLWTPLAREVHRLLMHLGAFRDVRMRYLHTRPDGSPGLSAHPAPHPGRIRDTSEIHDPSGRRLVLVLTDGVAPGWRDPSVREAMRQWATAGPLAVLQALPERLWRRTALPAVPARLRRAPVSAANTELAYTGRRRGTRELPAGSIPVPVLELSPEWLKPWAELVAGSGFRSTDAAVTLLGARFEPPHAFADAGSPARRLQDFHATASPEAFRLMACLSAVPLSVAIMRVVQAAMLPGSPPTVLAEVMFSGLITQTVTDGFTALADVPHDFLPGVRAALLESLRAHEVDQILREVSGFVERGADGAAGRISGLLPDLAGSAELPADGIPWALLREEALVRAGLATPAVRVRSSAADNARDPTYAASDPYRLTELINVADFSDVYLGADAEGNRAVVKVQPHGANPEPEVFRALLRVEAESLRRMGGQYAPPFLGIDRKVPPTWLAMGYVSSISGEPAHNLLTAPWWSNGPPDDFHALSQLARKLAEALERAHTQGIVHGNLSPHAVLLVPDAVVLISWVYAQFDGHPHPYPQYRARATGYLPPEGYPRDKPLDPSFDIYGLGAILLREATRDSTMTHDPRALSRLPSHLGDLRVLIGWCLKQEPRQRPSAHEIIAALRGLTPTAAPQGTPAVLRRGLRARRAAFDGDRHLLFLHGGEPQTDSPDQLRTSWALGLNQGLTRAGREAIDPADAWFPFYGDRLAAALAGGQSPDSAAREPDATYEDLLFDVAVELGMTARNTDGTPDRRRPPHRRARASMDWIASNSGLDSSEVPPLMRALARYLDDRMLRHTLLDAVLETVPQTGQLVVVAHGMGAVIALDVIDRLPSGTHLRSLVTVGSPLGLQTVHSRREGPMLGPVTRWTNIWCREDPLAVAGALSRVWPGEVEDLRVDNQSGSPSIEDYLSHPVVARHILAELA